MKLHSLVRASAHGKNLRQRNRKARPIKPSYKNELFYKASLLSIVGQLRKAANEILLPELKLLEPLYVGSGDRLVVDKLPRRSLETAFLRMAQRFGGIEQTANRLAGSVVDKGIKTVDERLKSSIKQSVSIDISPLLQYSPKLLTALNQDTTANIELIKSIPEQHFEKLSQVVYKNLEAGLRYESLVEQIQHIGDVTESRAKLIARDQTSKINSSFNQIRQTQVGISEYEWQTAGDERVREEHRANDGRTFKWDSPPSTGHPGEDIQCRCVAIPKFNLDREEELLGL